MTSYENEHTGTLRAPEAQSRRSSTASSSAHPEDARTLRNTLRSDFDYMELEKRGESALLPTSPDPYMVGHSGSTTLDNDGEEEVKEDEVVAQTTASALGDFPDGGLRAWLVVLGVRQVNPWYRS